MPDDKTAIDNDTITVQHVDAQHTGTDTALAEASAKHESTIARLVEETKASPEVVRKLFNRELATLTNGATIQTYVLVFAAKRVKALLEGTPPPSIH